MLKNELNSLLQKEMNRATFLKHVAIGFVAITGVSTVVKTMGGIGGGVPGGLRVDAPKAVATSYGYGASIYGGRRNVSSY